MSTPSSAAPWGVREEIGDFLFEGVFLAQLAEEGGKFTIADALQTVVEKLFDVIRTSSRRSAAWTTPGRKSSHPRQRWRWAVERAEGPGAADSAEQASTLGNVPKTCLLCSAPSIRSRVAGVGFDWAATTDVVAKIEEEVAELRETLQTANPGNVPRVEEEFGDLLFSPGEPLTQIGDRTRGSTAESEREVHEEFQGDGRER